MANSAKTTKEERVWNDPLPVDQKVPIAVSNNQLLMAQAAFLQDNPGYIYTYLQEMRLNNQRASGYMIGLLFICIGVMLYFIPSLDPELTIPDIVTSFLLCGVCMFIVATLMAMVKKE